MKKFKKDFEELTDNEKNVILKITVVSGISLLVSCVLINKHFANMKTLKQQEELNKRLVNYVIKHDTALDDLSKDVALLKKVVVKS